MLGLAGCASTRVRLDEGHVQEPLVDLESEVLEDTAHFEQMLQRSGRVYKDPQLSRYLETLIRPMIPQTLQQSETYRFDLQLVRDPSVNAFALANGSIYLHNGLIARLNHPHQLAHIVGHEIAHVMNRDQVYYRDQYYRRSTAAKVASLVIEPAVLLVGGGGLGGMSTNLVMAAAVTGYGRQQEVDADQESLRRMRELNYEVGVAPSIFRIFMDEADRYNKDLPVTFLSSHPASEMRLETVLAFLEQEGLEEIENPQDLGFLELTKDLRIENARRNLKFGRHHRALAGLEEMLYWASDDPSVQLALADTYRTIGEDPGRMKKELNSTPWIQWKDEEPEIDESEYWQGKARGIYQKLIAATPAAPEAFRGMAQLNENTENWPEALSGYREYLARSPQAWDRRYVRTRIERIEERLMDEAEEAE